MVWFLSHLLGKSLDDSSLAEFISNVNVQPEISEDEQGGGLFYSFKTLGIELQFLWFDPYELLATVFLFSGMSGDDGYSRFTGQLPENLTFDMSQAAVRQKLGSPAFSGETDPSHSPSGAVRPWDSYRIGKCDLFIEYSRAGEAIYLIKALLSIEELSNVRPRPRRRRR